MTLASLFSGFGGFDLAADWIGWETVLQCEKDPFCQKILRYYWPDARLFDCIKTADFTPYEGLIDVLTGGFPCQPYSVAGLRKGTADDRHLWPYMLRAIEQLRPRFVVGENVRGIVNWNGGLVFDQVQTDLEIAGYEVLPFVLPSCGVEAPHERQRTWFIAYSLSIQRERQKRRMVSVSDASGNERTSADTDLIRRREQSEFPGSPGSGTWQEPGGRGSEFTPDTERTGLAKPERTGLAKPEQGEFGKPVFDAQRADPRDASYSQFCGRLQNNGNRKPGFSHETIPPPDWQNFPTQSPVCSRDDGLPAGLDGITFPRWRRETIKAAGNAVVPQLVLQIYKAILEYDILHN